MEHRLSTNELANKLRSCGYTIVTESYNLEANSDGLYKIDHFEDAAGNITDGVVVRDGYPLDCLLAEPGANFKDSDGNISLRHSIIYGVEIYNSLKKIGLECSMSPDGVVRVWSNRRLALYDRFYRNREKLTHDKFASYVMGMGLTGELSKVYERIEEVFNGGDDLAVKYSGLRIIEKELRAESVDFFDNLLPSGELGFYVKGLRNFIKGEALKNFSV